MMEKRAPRMMDTHSLFGHVPAVETFDKLAAHVKSISGGVSTKQPEFPKIEPPKPYKPDFSFMDPKGKK
jgi:hypothetical protein